MKYAILFVVGLILTVSTAHSQMKTLPVQPLNIELYKSNDVDPQVYETCLNGIVYYLLIAHVGYTLAPKIVPARNAMRGEYVPC